MNPTLNATNQDIAPLNRIRVETALSRFPIHRIARKGIVTINIQRFSESGQTELRWKVSHNSEYGQPGPLAYKVDTLIVNRRIDEAPRPLPELVKLGSMADICKELDVLEGGDRYAQLRRSLLQNAFAAITAKVRYKTKSGKERWTEIGYTRYSVIFTGEALPNGTQADSVYILLNRPYRDLLDQVEVRPLDYDYLKCLPPGAQRFYELVSFQVYGAIASGRPRAKVLYSDYCRYCPQTRYFDFDHVKKQMYKIHVPHRECGYITKIDYGVTKDQEGQPDWEIFYTPGPKAFIEFRAFTSRHSTSVLPPTKRIIDLPLSHPEAPQQASLDLRSDENPTSAELTRRGITEKKVRELVANLKPGQELMDQLEYVDQIIALAPRGKFHNPSGFYVKFIEGNTTVPDTFWSTRKQRLHDEAEHAKNVARAHQAKMEIDYEEYQTAEVKRFISDVLPADEYQRLFDCCYTENRRRFKHMTATQLDELTLKAVYTEQKQSGRVPMLSFDEFCRQQPIES